MSLTEKKLESDVFNYLVKSGICDNSTIIVGLSGGPDSTSLLVCLSKICRKLNLTIKAAYVNHGMRDPDQLDKDDDFIVKLCEKLGVELFIHKIEQDHIFEKSKNEGRSSEDVAREIRYSFFYSLINSSNTFLALGHNRDDQFETMITRFFQGAGISGLKGIPHINGKIIRPLINTGKVELIQYLSEEKQTYCTDHTNSENIYLRNQVRNRLIPNIEQIFPGYKTALTSLQRRFSDIEEYFETQTQAAGIHYNEKDCSISLIEFNNSHKLIRLNILYKMFDFTYTGNVRSFRVPEGFFNPLISENIHSDRIFVKGYGIQIFSNGDSLIFKPFHSESSGFYAIIDKKTTVISDRFTVEQKEISSIKIELLNGSPLIFRSRQDGDFIVSGDKKKQLKNFFSQWDVNDEDKNLIPVLEDSEGIIAILGEILGYKNIYRNKKINSSQKFNILYLEVSKIFQE